MHSPYYHKRMEQRFWVSDGGGRYVFSSPTDRSVRVERLATLRIVYHKPCKVSVNPYFDQEYLMWLRHYRDVQKANGKYKIVWDQQDGKCEYCGECMLADQEIEIIEKQPGRGRRLENLRYIHSRCAYDSYYGGKDHSFAGAINLVQMLEDYIADTTEQLPTEESPYAPLTEYFFQCEKRSLTLYFIEIEEILGQKLPWEACKFQSFWRENAFDIEAGQRTDLWEQEGYPIHAIELSLPDYCIADSWLKYGYKINGIDFEKKKISFRRGVVLRGTAGRALQRVQQIEKILLAQKLPHAVIKDVNAALEEVIAKHSL